MARTKQTARKSTSMPSASKAKSSKAKAAPKPNAKTTEAKAKPVPKAKTTKAKTTKVKAKAVPNPSQTEESELTEHQKKELKAKKFTLVQWRKAKKLWEHEHRDAEFDETIFDHNPDYRSLSTADLLKLGLADVGDGFSYKALAFLFADQ